MTFSEVDEYPLLPPPSTPNWAESFAIVFADPRTRVAGFCHIGTWSGDTSVWRERLAIVLPDGTIVAAMGFGRRTTRQAASASLCTFEITEPAKHVRLAYDGPAFRYTFEELLRTGMVPGTTKRLSVELAFDASAPTWDMHSNGADSTGMAGSLHTEQLGEVAGRISVESNHFAIRGAHSCRDHSRGPRDVSNYRNHTWINGRFASGFAFCCYVLRTLSNPGMSISRAAIFENGVRYEATVAHVEFVESLNDHGRLHRLVLSSVRGEALIEVDEVIATIPISFSPPFDPTFGASRGTRVNRSFDEAVLLSYAGDRGVGWCERGFSPVGVL